MGNRRHARELAMQALYYIDMSHRQPKEALSLFRQNFSPPKRIEAFFRDLVDGVLQNRDTIDRIIERFSDHWRVSRMAAVDRNVIRIAVYEMLQHPDIPPKVSINEAIDIGKRFGTDDSGPFINGILDGVRLAIDRGEIAPLPAAPTPCDSEYRSDT